MNKRIRKSYWSLGKFYASPDAKYYLRLEKRINNKEMCVEIEIPFGTYYMIRTKLDNIENNSKDVYEELFENEGK